MNTSTTKLASLLIATSLTLFNSVHATEAHTDAMPSMVAEKTETSANVGSLSDQVVLDLQQQLTNGIKQQASKALTQVVESIKAMLP